MTTLAEIITQAIRTNSGELMHINGKISSGSYIHGCRVCAERNEKLVEMIRDFAANNPTKPPVLILRWQG